MSFNRFSFFVPGVPATAGSKKAFVNRKTGKPQIVDDCKNGPSWRESVRVAAFGRLNPLGGHPIIDEPVELNVVFFFVRPKGHYRKSERFDGQLKATAPNWPTKPPDVTKLLRAIEDALTGVVWRDDASVVVQAARKVYADRPGAFVTISPALYPSDYEENRDRKETRMSAIMSALNDSDGT